MLSIIHFWSDRPKHILIPNAIKLLNDWWSQRIYLMILDFHHWYCLFLCLTGIRILNWKLNCHLFSVDQPEMTVPFGWLVISEHMNPNNWMKTIRVDRKTSRLPICCKEHLSWWRYHTITAILSGQGNARYCKLYITYLAFARLF